MSRPNTLAEVVERVLAGEASDKAIGEFLDQFYGAESQVARIAMLAQEPGLASDPRLDALVAAVAEYLSKQYALGGVPQWVSGPERRLDQPWFTSQSQADGMREFLTFSSPAEFVHHNIFCEARPLRRASQRRLEATPAPDASLR